MNSKIILSGMEFYAHHGCFKEERHVGAHFKVDLVLEYDALSAALFDDIDHAVNYKNVYCEVKETMKAPVNLLETICYNILNRIKEEFPQVKYAEVTVQKLNPALGGKMDGVKVTIAG